MISSSSSLASGTPATSSKVTFFCSGVSSLALDLPKDMALVPPACICRKKTNHRPTRISSGRPRQQGGQHSTVGGFLDLDDDVVLAQIVDRDRRSPGCR